MAGEVDHPVWGLAYLTLGVVQDARPRVNVLRQRYPGASDSPLGALGSECVALYEVIAADGSAISNKAAREALGWESEPHFSVRDRFEDAGFILCGRGRGGTVRRIPEEAPAEPGDADAEAGTGDEAADALADSFRRENDLYAPMQE